MKSISPYLNFPGTAEEAFTLYRSLFGGEFSALHRFRESPGCGQMPAADLDKIMHISLPLPGGAALMATDALASAGQHLTYGNNSYIHIDAESEAEATRLFNGLAGGGSIEMPLQKMFWGALFGCLTDRFGIRWMVSYRYPR